jgi:hypothetical protein
MAFDGVCICVLKVVAPATQQLWDVTVWPGSEKVSVCLRMLKVPDLLSAR